MNGAWIVENKHMGSSYVCSSLPVVFALNPELQRHRAAIYRIGRLETDDVVITRAQMYRPQDVR